MVQMLSPKNVTSVTGAGYVFDMGQNFSGWCVLAPIVAAAGTTVVLRHAEVLLPNGTLYVTNLRSGICIQHTSHTHTYIRT